MTLVIFYRVGYDCQPFERVFDYVCMVAGGTIRAAEMINAREARIAINLNGGWHHAHRLLYKLFHCWRTRDLLSARASLFDCLVQLLFSALSRGRTNKSQIIARPSVGFGNGLDGLPIATLSHSQNSPKISKALGRPMLLRAILTQPAILKALQAMLILSNKSQIIAR